MSLRMVFDVESMGLHGVGFAVGAVVMDGYREVDSLYAACPVTGLPCREEDWRWLEEHCFPALPMATHEHPRAVREVFWSFWRKWADKGATLWADCGWPVEARFLAACVDDNPEARCWQGPYPLHEIAEHIGMDTHERLSAELPAHNPLNDARQSARLLCEALRARVAELEGGTD